MINFTDLKNGNASIDTYLSRSKIKLCCNMCDKAFFRTKKEIQRALSRNAKGAYCGRNCQSNAQVKRSTFFCEVCSSPVVRTPSQIEASGHIFCSSSCSAKNNNKGVCRHQRSDKKGIINGKSVCVWCSNEAKKGRSYCSKKCQADCYFNTYTAPRVELGLISGRDILKKYLRNVSGDFCSICNCEPTHNGLPLGFQLDHIDGNSDNNLPSNIRLVCPNCHSQTPTYMGRNVGKHQTLRSRYRKSYYHCDGVLASAPKIE